MKDFSKMSIAQLEKANEQLMRKRARLLEEQRALVEALDGKRKAAALAEDLKTIEERHGVTISPPGIESTEKVQG